MRGVESLADRRRNTFNVDEELNAPFDWKHLSRAMGYIKHYKGNFIKTFFISVLAILLTLLTPLLTKLVIDDYIPQKNIPGILIAGLVFVAVSIVIVVCNRARSRLNSVSGQYIISEMRADLFSHLQKLPFDYYDSRPAGKILVRVVNYVNTVADFLSSGLINFVIEPLSMIFIVAYAALFVSWRLTLVMLCGLPLFVLYIFLIKTRQRRAWQLFSNKQSNMTAYLAENVNGVRVTQAFSREGVNQEVMEGLLDDNRGTWMKAAYITHSMWPVTAVLARLVTAAIYIVGVAALTGTAAGLTVGTVIAMANYASRFWGPLQNLGNLYNNLINTVAYLERIFQVLDEPVTVTDREGAYELPVIRGNVTFMNVEFAYEPGIPVLKGMTFEALEGESIALVGPTGAGKSTIINLLSRFYNLSGGTVYVDGHDIDEVTLPSLRRQMGIMLQDTFIFSGSIIGNIRYGRLDATDAECIEAAKAVFADEFIQKLPKGYYTPVNERGEGLSAGQKQLISFARTLLSDPRILILDEATSSIDTNTERLVQEGIARLLVGRTSFIVAHRLSTIRNCSKILYIDNGNIAEMGSHGELMEKRGLYYKLYMSQSGA
ncbi:MAG: ABC transporter ATP-binding protein/permease [Oscillospiraceae bacterium]|jgi:ATP-binding cassette subfamily B protein|nr:ABC transporter ATP-binding protein/permease [Oscillospiraceae bacterium]